MTLDDSAPQKWVDNAKSKCDVDFTRTNSRLPWRDAYWAFFRVASFFSRLLLEASGPASVSKT